MLVNLIEEVKSDILINASSDRGRIRHFMEQEIGKEVFKDLLFEDYKDNTKHNVTFKIKVGDKFSEYNIYVYLTDSGNFPLKYVCYHTFVTHMFYFSFKSMIADFLKLGIIKW